jgi:UDP-N-acetylmuramate--alanine ligase
MLGKIRRIHFVGIGGIGMSGIAEVLLNLGFIVSGSDVKMTLVTERLEQLGARIFEGHSGTHVHDAQVLVTSSAVSADNSEVLEAQRLQVPVIPRAEMLAELMRLKTCIAVAGAHGKTTVTSIIAVILANAGLDPTAVIGGRLDAFGSSARLGNGELMVVEADESDRSFLYLLPTIAVVTNIDLEHLEHYHSLDEIVAAFASFMNKVPFYGAIVACSDPPWRDRLNSLQPLLRRRLVTYGMAPGADVVGSALELTGTGSSFQVSTTSGPLGCFRVNVPGRHNVQNALAAIAVGLELDLGAEQIRQGLDRFRGADRRFQLKGEVGGVRIFDDYGHHPAEIRATLAAAQLAKSDAGRIWAIFQPHRYTRTQALMDEFARAFEDCERVFVIDIYPASEKPIPGITSERLVYCMHQLGFERAVYEPTEDKILAAVAASTRPGDLVLTIGAGNVWRIGEALRAVLERRSEVAAITGSPVTT